MRKTSSTPTQFRLLVLAGTLLSAFTSAQAETILIDFGQATSGTAYGTPYGPTTSPDVNGLYWNNLTGIVTTSAPLIDTTGATSGVSIAGTGWQAATAGGTPSTVTSGTGIVYPQSAGGDAIYLGPNRANTMTLSGLNPNLLYTFTFLNSFHVAGGTLTMTFTGLDGDTVTATSPLPNDGTAPNMITVTTGPLAPTANGMITVVASNTLQAELNVFEIDTESIPEPSTVALFIIGGLGLGVLAIRKRQQIRIS